MKKQPLPQYEHIHPDFQKLMKLNDSDRIESLYEPFWIGYPKSLEIINYLNSLMNRPKKARMENLMILAEPNMGKTTLIRHFAELHPHSTIQDEDKITWPIRSIIIAEAPASADERGMYSAILEGFWTTYRPTDTVAKLRHQVIHLMQVCHVKILILDEFHNLLAGTPAKQRLVMNSIKSLSNILAIPIVAVGIKDAYKVISYDPQLVSRFDVVRLEKWEKALFQKLLASFEERLPLKEKSNLYSMEIAPRLYEISNGNLGNLHKLLVDCCKNAILTGEERISVETVDKFKWHKTKAGLQFREL